MARIDCAPDAEDEAPTQRLPVFHAGASLEGRYVLIVEDDAASAKLIAVVLEGEGCATRVATSAESALEAFEDRLPDLIVLDLILPMMSGLLFAEIVRAAPPLRHIPIIAVSAFNGSEAERAARAAGCSIYVRKPIDAIAFPELVLAHLGVSHDA